MNARAATTDAATVFEQVRTAILQGEYVPGQRLIESDLCERFTATRFVMHAALQDLAAHGLVEFQRNRGARVRELSFPEAIEITELRQLLEGFVAARAASVASDEQVSRLRELIENMRDAVAAGELVRYGDLNAALHGALREAAGHREASRILEQLRDLTVRHAFKLSLLPGRSSVSLPQHEAIVDAVAKHDPTAAEQAMRTHLQSVVDALRELSAGAGPR